MPFVAIATCAMLVLVPTTPALAAPVGVDPPTVNVTLTLGAHTTVTKKVTTPPIAPKPDIYFLADTTGSMDPVLNNVKTNAASILTAIDAAASDPRYGAGDYKDFQSQQVDPYAYKNGASMPAADDNGAAALAAINAWTAGGGVDIPEGNLFALHELISAANFRAGATKIVVWFGDAPGHDPVCQKISGQPDITEASVTADLVAAGVKVIAVSSTTGASAAGLDGNPVAGANDYVSDCGAPGGTAGQATRIAAATGGSAFINVPPANVSATILGGLTNLPVTVTPVATCAAGLTATFDHASRTVTSGDTAVFQETLTLAADATPGDKVCTVDFRLNGSSAGPAFIETNTVKQNRPPVCTAVKASPGSLWPPNHKFRTITLAGATDPEGDSLTLTITGVTQDEALNGLGDGDTAPDARAAARPDQVEVRAERSGTGDGRVYRIAFSVSDGKNTCTGKANVGVPHDQSGDPAVDTTGVIVNSFGP